TKAVASGRYLDYVRRRMAVPLAATAILMLAVSVATIGRKGGPRPSGGEAASGVRELRIADDSQGGRPRHRRLASRVRSILAVPVVLMGVVPAAPLGAFAAALQPAGWRAPPTLFPPLPAPVGGAAPIGMSDFVSRALFDPARSLRGVRVRLIGFAAPDPGARRGPTGGFLLLRFALYCCAAHPPPLPPPPRAPPRPPPPPPPPP